MQNQTCRKIVLVMGQGVWFKHTNGSLTNQRVFFRKNAYLLLGWHQEFLDHHAVPGVGASVQGVRPIRTEGAEAVVFTVNHSRVVDDDEMNKKKLMHATSKTGKMAKNINKSCSWKHMVKKKIPYIWGNLLSLDNLMVRFCLKFGRLVLNLWEDEMHENSGCCTVTVKPTWQLRRTRSFQIIW